MTVCPGGGIGIRVRLRCVWGNPCRFKSCPGHMKQSYTPKPEVLEKYADLIVRFGLRSRHGGLLKKGSTVRFIVPEVAKPMYFYLQRSLLKLGYNPLGIFLPSSDKEFNFERNFFDNASPAQINHFAAKYQRGLIDEIAGTIYIEAQSDMHSLEGVSDKKIAARAVAQKQAKEWTWKKIDAGQLNWTIALYGTDAAAKEAGLSPRAFWQEIIKACYLDSVDPVKEWTRIDRTVSQTAKKLTDLAIDKIHLKGPDVDLMIGIGADRVWRAGGGNNIPSFEVFTSPDCRRVDGWIRFNQPLLRSGKRVEGIELWFKDGKVVKAKATKNYDLLKSMLKTKGGDRAGEFSLTDGRLSRITKFMAETLFDENRGGRYGNTHIALGSAYRDCHRDHPKPKSDKEWEQLGFNDSVVHCDIVSTANRTATAHLKNGTEKVIYKDGKFLV